MKLCYSYAIYTIAGAPCVFCVFKLAVRTEFNFNVAFANQKTNEKHAVHVWARDAPAQQSSALFFL